MEAQEDPGEVVNPVRRSAAGLERVLEAVVEALHHPVRLRLAVLDVEQAAQGGPQGEDELGPVV